MSASSGFILAVVSSLPSVLAIAVSLIALHQSRQTATREAIEEIYDRWWGDEIRDLRLYFFLEFVPKYRALVNDASLKEIERLVPEDHGRARRLCYYFDEVGWLCASGLVRPDYVLGPMQHAMRKTWIVMEPLIVKERELGTERGLDPVFQLGFEWLFMRSERPLGHQAVVVARAFHRKPFGRRRMIRVLRTQIDRSEADFRAALTEKLTPGSVKATPTLER